MLKPRIYMGAGAVEKLLAGISRAFIVTDRFMQESGKVRYLTDPMDAHGVAYEIFSEVKPDPDIGTVARGMEQMLEFRPQILFALGGGSAIDAAKAMNWLSMKGGLAERIPFAAIPTTSGTGSEVSRFSVISDPERSAKYPLVSDEVIPDAAVLDVELVRSVPPAVTADTGIDVFTHAVEAFVSTGANDFTDAAAEKALTLVRENLPLVCEKPDDRNARQNMHHASCLAGIAFSNAGLGLVHGMAHTLGAHFHLPHGRANGILLPYVMAFNAGCHDGLTPAAARYAKLSGVLGLTCVTARQGAFGAVRAAMQLVKRLGLPASIRAAGIEKAAFEAALPEMTESALRDACTGTNPRVCSEAEIRAVFRRAYDGDLF